MNFQTYCDEAKEWATKISRTQLQLLDSIENESKLVFMSDTGNVSFYVVCPTSKNAEWVCNTTQYIQYNLTCNKHIHQITASANRTLAFVRRINLHSCPKNIKTTAYTTLVRPLLEYSSSVWDPHTQVLINKIEMVQRWAARFCHNDYTSRETGCVSEMITKLP